MRQNEIMLSIMIETYNQENFIGQTIDSIINQDFDFLYEIIVGDDCSTDKTSQILDEYAQKYKNIKVIHNKENLGAMGNFYNVLSNIQGKYIMDCAGDDYWLPGKVRTQISYLEKHDNIGLCYGRVKYLYDSKRELSKPSYGGRKTKYNELFMGNTIPALTVCYRKELVEQYLNQIHPEKQGWKLEDIPMWLWFAKNSKIKFLKKDLGVYRVMEESESHSDNSVKYQAYVKSCSDVRKFYADLYNEESLWKIYKKNLDFNTAWSKKKYENIIYIGRELQKEDFSLKRGIKIFVAEHPNIFSSLLKK